MQSFTFFARLSIAICMTIAISRHMASQITRPKVVSLIIFQNLKSAFQSFPFRVYPESLFSFWLEISGLGSVLLVIRDRPWRVRTLKNILLLVFQKNISLVYLFVWETSLQGSFLCFFFCSFDILSGFESRIILDLRKKRSPLSLLYYY